jgi:hypothetical protein
MTEDESNVDVVIKLLNMCQMMMLMGTGLVTPPLSSPLFFLKDFIFNLHFSGIEYYLAPAELDDAGGDDDE